MSFIDSFELADRAKEPKISLLSRLRKNAKKIVVGAALVTTAAAGYGVMSHTQNENNERAASIEYRLQSKGLSLSDEFFNIGLNTANLTQMNLSQLGEYGYFCEKCMSYLNFLGNDTENNLKETKAGTIDPAQRFGKMYDQLDFDIQKTGDKLVSNGGSDKNAAFEYQILGKVKAQMQALEPTINSAKSRAERYDIVKVLFQTASQKAQSVAARQIQLYPNLKKYNNR